jgi:hypothetical protein
MINPIEISTLGSKAFAVPVGSINGRFEVGMRTTYIMLPVPLEASEN